MINLNGWNLFSQKTVDEEALYALFTNKDETLAKQWNMVNCKSYVASDSSIVFASVSSHMFPQICNDSALFKENLKVIAAQYE